MSNPIQQAIETLESCRIIATPSGRDLSPRLVKEALTSLRSLQKEVEGVELPDPKYIYHNSEMPGEDELFEFVDSGAVDEDCPHCERLYTADQLRAAVAAALGRGAVPQVSGFSAAPSPEATQPTQAEAPSIHASIVALADELDGGLDSGAAWTKAQHTACSVSGTLRAIAEQVKTLENDCKHLIAALREEIEAPVFIPLQAEAPSEREVLQEEEAWMIAKRTCGVLHGNVLHMNRKQVHALALKVAALATQQAAFTQADMNAEYVRGRADGWNAACVAEPPRRQQAVQGEPIDEDAALQWFEDNHPFVSTGDPMYYDQMLNERGWALCAWKEATRRTLATPPAPGQVEVPDDVLHYAKTLKKEGYSGPLHWARTVIDWVVAFDARSSEGGSND